MNNNHDKRDGGLPPAPPRLLVADDNAVNRMLAVGLAQQLGYAADSASDGEQALRMLAARRYALVLMDCEMPHLDGYAACRRLRLLESGLRHTPVVALTAGDGVEQRAACREAGMDDFLSKPLALPSLRQMLARWLPDAPASAGWATDATDAADAGDSAGLDAVAQRFGARYRELAELYLADSPLRLSALHLAVAEADCAAVEQLAHAFSGSSAALGAQRLSAQCRALELLARGGEREGLAARLAAVEVGHRQVVARLRALLQASAQS